MWRASLVLLSALGLGSGAQGQSGDRWLVLPTTAGPNDAWVGPTAEALQSELDARAWPLSDAARQFEEAGSSRSAALQPSEVEQWVAQSNDAIRDLSEGDYEKALTHLRAADALSRRATEQINRAPKRAQRALDTCLYEVRIRLATGARSQARAQAEHCRRLVPRVEATKYMHPPEVLDLLGEVDDSQASKPRLLEVDSNPPGCAVRVNGIAFGKTPLEVRDLLPGVYRVQVECEPGRTGRVHVADLTTASATVFVDARFDRTVATAPVLHLRYDSVAALDEHRAADAAEVARAVPSRWILLASEPDSGILELELADSDSGRIRAWSRVRTGPDGPSSAATSLAVDALLGAKCTDFTSGEPASQPCGTKAASVTPLADVSRPASRMPRRGFVAGITLASFGAASLVTGYLLLIPQAAAGDDWLARIDAGAVETPQEQEKWVRIQNGVFTTAAIGSASLVTAMPLVLPKHRGIPWPAWLVGGVGLGALAFSIAYPLTGDAPPRTCRSGDNVNTRPAADVCINHGQRVSLAVLAGTTSAPLLTVPLVYLFRRTDKKLEPRIEASRRGGYFGVGGAF